MYLERIRSTGMAGNKYWYNNAWNKGAGTVNGLANCTCFCLGELLESSEAQEPKGYFTVPYQREGAFPTAKNWYSLWKGKKGVEPKVGGVVVWGATKGDGHVAFVLETKDAGTRGAWIKVCQSHYQGVYFEVKEYYVKKGVVTDGVGYPYIGCCYNTVKDLRTTRDKNLLQVEVLADELNVRMTPNGTSYAGRVCPKGLYNVYDRQKMGSYTWAQLDKDTWIALNDKDGWTKTYELETVEAKYKALLNAYEILSQKYTDLVLRYEKETGGKV